MKYFILSIYDSWWNYSIMLNGEYFDKDTDLAHEIYKLYWDMINYQEFVKYLIHLYNDCDLIVICEDGDITILKGGDN